MRTKDAAQAKDIMHRKVITARPEMTLGELVRVFDDHHISGAPVVGPEGDLVGVISQTDLVRRERTTSPRMVPDYHQHLDGGGCPKGFRLEVPGDARVETAMTPWVISFEEETPIKELARQMLAKQIHRVIITREGRLSGIVTSMDLLRALLTELDRK
jgi:CBS domain-containing protein